MIATGTPAGIGAVRQPFTDGLLNVGDPVTVQIDGIGELSNTVIEEPDGYLAGGAVPASIASLTPAAVGTGEPVA